MSEPNEPYQWGGEGAKGFDSSALAEHVLEHVEEIEVEPVAEPDEPEQGVIDPADDYTEGGTDER